MLSFWPWVGKRDVEGRDRGIWQPLRESSRARALDGMSIEAFIASDSAEALLHARRLTFDAEKAALWMERRDPEKKRATVAAEIHFQRRRGILKPLRQDRV